MSNKISLYLRICHICKTCSGRRAQCKLLHKTTFRSFHHQPNISLTPPISSFQTAQHRYTYLLQTCLQQCKNLQSSHLFDELSHRLPFKTGQLIHAQMLRHVFTSKGQLDSALIDLYAKCGNVGYAEKAFDKLEFKDALAWNAILSLYSRRGFSQRVLGSFSSLHACIVSPNQFTYAIVFSACAKLTDIGFGKQVHCIVVKTGFQYFSFCEGALIDMYSKCSSMIDAKRVFDYSVDPDTVSWTAMISGYVQIGMPQEALNIFEEMQKTGHVPDEVAFGIVLSACIALGRLDEACDIFYQMPNRNVVAWNVMISGHAQGGYETEAIRFFQNMWRSGLKSTRSTLGSILSAIASVEALHCGMMVHAQAIKQGLDANVYVGSSLINMYAKCERMENAKKAFDSLEEKNLVLWNAMLKGYAQNGYTTEVVDLYFSMSSHGFQPDGFTYTSILRACACLGCLELGHQLHCYIIKNKLDTNLYVANGLVDMYAKFGDLSEATKLFGRMRNRDKISWNAIISGYVQNNEEDKSFSMFRRMISDGIEPDEVALASILSACANLQARRTGREVHCSSMKCGLDTSLYAGSSLIDMYAKSGAMEAAHRVFACMPQWSVASVNALIAGYSMHNLEEAVSLFQDMRADGLSPSEVTFAGLLDGCNRPYKLNMGRQIHCLIIKMGLFSDDEFLMVSLLGMYMNSSETTEANLLFSEFPSPKSSVLWTAAISGNIQNDCCEDALQLYREMRKDNAIPDQATYACVLKACAMLASTKDGRVIHSLIFHTGFHNDELTNSALIDMYAKCGDVTSSTQVFEEMVERKDVISWNSVIVGLAKNGNAGKAMQIFDEMMQTGIQPDDVTFLGVLTACSHAGLVVEGRKIFSVMVNNYKINPRVDHCACMVDLLGRWGFLGEAEEFINKLNSAPDVMIWSSLLGACSLHGDDMRGRRAAEKLIELEPQNSAPYVLLANIYAKLGNWDDFNSVRRAMKDKGVIKFPGCSWIDLGQTTHSFVAGDKFHPCAYEIRATVKNMTPLLKEYGYVAGTNSFCSVEE